MELLTVIAVLVILAAMLLGAGKRLRVQAEEKLTQSQIDVLVTALEQYYAANDDEFPFEADADYDEAALLGDIQTDTGAAAVSVTSGTHIQEYCSSEGLYYFLDKSVVSREIAEAISETLVTCKDADGVFLRIDIDGESLDPARFIDPWGKSLRYTYAAGNTFPVIVSAGVDGDFGTEDDITSK